jgi:hypothetical protein
MMTVNIKWGITTDDKARVKAIIDQQLDTDLVRGRHMWNLAETKKKVERAEFWCEMVCSRLTALAAGDAIEKFEQLAHGPEFPLAYDKMCREQSPRENFIHRTLSIYKVGAFRKVISKDLANNFDLLESGEWGRTLDQCNRLTSLQSREVEAEVAEYIDETFRGFGPKLSRNVLQELGLTRYEIPIDNRVAKWLNDELKFPFKVTAKGLSDKDYYALILDGVYVLCAECGEFPCVLDAAIWSVGSGHWGAHA